MSPLVEFLAHRLNGGTKPITFYADDPVTLPPSSYSVATQSAWTAFVERLYTGDAVSRLDLLEWLGVFVEQERKSLTLSEVPR